ncbi:hypothetical protein CVT26_011760 [Gymnopilus dilepis]|uniref:Uncharacterized protein n=1 Tax=Gymnopilus dilepis TaxID=231916 RepID=A0A409WUH4_9AGAR|nr:hypothetical protein CVT26_011760 [Gymnopilus dilepis]
MSRHQQGRALNLPIYLSINSERLHAGSFLGQIRALLKVDTRERDSEKEENREISQEIEDNEPKLFQAGKCTDGFSTAQPQHDGKEVEEAIPAVLVSDAASGEQPQKETNLTSSTADKTNLPTNNAGSRPNSPNAPVNRRALISKKCYDSSYISARLSNVQILEEKICLLVVRFQCHPSPGQRFTILRIKWQFQGCHDQEAPSLEDVAPKQCIWDKTREHKDTDFKVNIPFQFTIGSIALGPQFEQQWKTQKTIQRGTTLTGSIRGLDGDAAEWTVEENASAMSGVPPHFCIAAVVNYEAPFLMEMEISAIQRRTSNVLPVSKIDQAKSESTLVDVEKLHRTLPDYKPAHGWREWFPEISGEVRGGGIELGKVAFSR